MSKKMKVFIAAGLAILLLIVGVAIPVMADTDPTPTATPPVAITKQAGVLDRTAQILQITKDTLVNAMKLAATDLKGTKPTADEYFARVASHLTNITKDQLVAALQQAAKETRDANMDTRLGNAVTKGIITANEEAQMKAWFAQRPSAVDKLLNFRALQGLKAWGRCYGFFKERGERGNFKNQPKLSPSPTATTTAFTTY